MPRVPRHAVTRSGARIRLTDEHWRHIVAGHPELEGLQREVLRAVAHPDAVFAGGGGELLAVSELEPSRWIVAVYREEAQLWIRHHRVSHEEACVARPEARSMALSDIRDYLKLVPAARKAPGGSLWVSYDRDADTVYVHFREPKRATDTEMTDDDVIIRYDGSEVIGLTILRASER